MILDFSENGIFIVNATLKSNQISQLNFWGFDNDDRETFSFTGANKEELLIKVYSYFQKEKVSFNLSEKCSAKINQHYQKTAEFQAIKKIGSEFKNGNYDKILFNEFKKFAKVHLSRDLKPHQLKAAHHLYLTHNGANFSVPGSGKTSVVLSVYEKLKYEGKVNILFVVGPPACFGPWKNEFIETLGRKPTQKVLAGGDKGLRKSEYFANSDNKLELYLTTFQTLINDHNEINNFFSQKGINVFLVIDEAHYIKQVNGNWANAVLKVAKHAKYRCILTGTPIPKSFSDVYNLFDFLWPQNEIIESSVRIKLHTLEKNNNIDDAKAILDDRIGPLFYRVRKNDLGLMPPKFHDPIVLPMNKFEGIVYQAIERKIRHYSMTDYLQNIDFIDKLKKGRMVRLRQSVSYLRLLNKTIEDYDENLLKDEKDLRHIIRDYDNLELPAKLQFLFDKVEELQRQKQKVVIWTNFVGTIEKLLTCFNKELRLYCRAIYGKTPIEQSTISEELTRDKIRDEFVDPKSGLDILVANPAACAESISLHKTCHNAIYYDLSYNCAQYLQSLDRIHRVGGSENTEANYYFLQYQNSVDQDILSNLRKKAERMSNIIDQDYKVYSLDMSSDDNEEINAYDRLFGKI